MIFRVGETSWELNFLINNFAQNNGNKSDIKSRRMRVIFLSKLPQMCVIFAHLFNIRWNKILQKAPATRTMFLPQKEIVCKSLHATGRNFLFFEEISCHRVKIPVTRRYFLILDESFCHRKKFALTAKKIFLSQENIFCHRKKFPVMGRNFSQEIFFPVKQYVLPVRDFFPLFAMSIHLVCTNSIFPITKTLFFCER